MRWAGTVGLARAFALTAALALILCDLSRGPGLTPAQAGFFSKAKSGAKDKETEKDKTTSSSSSSSSATTEKKPSGFFSKTSKPPTSSGGPSTPTTSGTKPDASGSQGGFFSGTTRTPRPTPSTSRGTVTVPSTPASRGGYFSRTSTRSDVPVWKPGGTPAGVFRSTRTTSSASAHRSAQGYFSQVKRLKDRSRDHYYAVPYPVVVDWWWWWYPYDLRFYHWYFGYYDPFATDYAFVFVYAGRPGYAPYPYYVYYPPPRANVIVIARGADDDGGYNPYASPPQGALAEAVGDIEQTWYREDINRLLDHVDPNGSIRVYYRDTFSHTMTAGEFQDLTLQAFETTRTVSMRLDRVTPLSDGWARASGRHIFYDANGDRRTVFVYYLLEEVRDGWRRAWLIREIGQGPEPY
jgi:hypothetical protein